MDVLKRLKDKIEELKKNYEKLEQENLELKKRLEASSDIECEEEIKKLKDEIERLKQEIEEKDVEIESILENIEALLD